MSVRYTDAYERTLGIDTSPGPVTIEKGEEHLKLNRCALRSLQRNMFPD